MLRIALKEWAVICELLLEGRQSILLRKGGIQETAGPGRFQLEHDRFALFPAWEHQNLDGLKPAWHARMEPADGEPQTLTLRGVGQVAAIWPVPSRAAFDRLDDLHGWARPQIDMRFNYMPERPLYLLAIRASRLARPKRMTMKPAYWGCKSWVPLEERDAVDDDGAVPVMDDEGFAMVVRRIGEAMKGPK